MRGEFLISLAVLVLLCLYGSGDHANPYKTHHDPQPDDDLFDT